MSPALPVQTFRRYAERRGAELFDRVFDTHRVERLERIVIIAAAVGLLVHLALIGLGHLGVLPGSLAKALGPNYLSALYTPFSFILFHEVLLLILSIPESTTRAIGKQFEIVTLVIVRRVFKDLSEFESATIDHALSPELVAVLVDMGGGLAMFLLVSVFYHVHRRFGLLEEEDDTLTGFIRRKKIIALGLAALLVVLAFYNLIIWGNEAVHILTNDAQATLHVDSVFYSDLFTVMIFTDVLIVLLAMWRDSAFHFVFRNASFVAATILLRLSLTVAKPYSIELALLAVIFAIAVALVFHYFRRYAPTSERDHRAPPQP